MQNPFSIKKLAPYLALFLLISNACSCASETPSVIASPEPAPANSKAKQKEKQAAKPENTDDQCSLAWVEPGGAGYTGNLPQSGETPFTWEGQPGASSYQLVVTQPNGSTIPYASNDPTKKLYMENYKQSGQYTVTLSALDASGQPICSITLTFTKQAPPSKANTEDGEPAGPNPNAGGTDVITIEVPR